MADHARKQIRDAVVALVTGLTTTGARVYPNHVYPLAAANLPGLMIHNGNDDVIDRSQGDHMTARHRSEMRTMSLTIEAKAKASAALDDELDTICAEVETAVLADPLLGGLAFDTRLMPTTFEFDGGGDQPHGTAIMTFEFDYWTVAGAPTAITN